MSSYIIEFANGDAPIEVDGYLDVEPTLRAKYGHRVEIGHNGDLSDGGERTLFWADKKDAENDDGANALGEVRSLSKLRHK